MNFLSHFYFDRHCTDCYYILGTVMPDLLKNADKSANIHPEKSSHHDTPIQSLINGWKKHLEVDRHFHNSAFFKYHSHQLKLALLPALQGSPVKPFFLGHVALELVLDNLLLTEGRVEAGDFYHHLEGCTDDNISRFLQISSWPDAEVFLNFYHSFKKSRYLYSYIEIGQVSYALKRICSRIWHQPFTPEQESLLNNILADYRQKLLPVFMEIYQEIELKLAG